MNYREVVNNIVSDAKLLTKMTAQQSSIFRRKIYGRINEATHTEEINKEIQYPNKKRKIIDKDNNIGSLLVLYKGLMEKYTTFTNRSKHIQKRNYELEAALEKEKLKTYYKTLTIIIYQLCLMTFIIYYIIWKDDKTLEFYQTKYKEYKKISLDFIWYCVMFIVENYMVPCLKIMGPLLIKWLKFTKRNYIFPFIKFVINYFNVMVESVLENYIIPGFNIIFPCYNLTAVGY
jgi:hypothetical protein